MTKARRYSKRNATSSSECQRQSCTETRSRDPHAVEVVVVAISMMVVLTRFVVLGVVFVAGSSRKTWGGRSSIRR